MGHMHARVHTHTNAHARTHICTHARTCAHALAHAHTRALTHTCKHARVHSHLDWLWHGLSTSPNSGAEVRVIPPPKKTAACNVDNNSAFLLLPSWLTMHETLRSRFAAAKREHQLPQM